MPTGKDLILKNRKKIWHIKSLELTKFVLIFGCYTFSNENIDFAVFVGFKIVGVKAIIALNSTFERNTRQ